MLTIKDLNIRKNKNKNGIEICKNVEELNKSLKSNIKVLKEVLESEDIKCRFEMHNGNILIKDLNLNTNIIRYIILRMLVFQNNVYMGYIKMRHDKVQVFSLDQSSYNEVIEKILNKR